ncbi:helix-turn-helix transcriptional regulator [Enterococcus mundtii]|uniref:helix-turn-helix transcriptional regulator n=1 Tax=Enterococcus mundtii TaxID=53346 RepID=UPI001FB8FFCB|nr:hypothetical protein [Enterococcus mundtii]GKS53949.1 transcriptional regulator [Enterococcus mundtii]
MSNKIAGYRKMLGHTQESFAREFGISKQAYRLKEVGKTSFNDREKVKFKKMLQPLFPDITVDEIFFNQ